MSVTPLETISIGVLLLLLVPSPSCPLLFHPKEWSEPSDFKTKEWAKPAETLETPDEKI